LRKIDSISGEYSRQEKKSGRKNTVTGEIKAGYKKFLTYQQQWHRLRHLKEVNIAIKFQQQKLKPSFKSKVFDDSHIRHHASPTPDRISWLANYIAYIIEGTANKRTGPRDRANFRR